MKKNVYAQLIIAILCVALASCGGSEEGSSDNDLEKYENLGAGYDVFDNYADVTKVKAQILDLSQLEKNGMLEIKRLEKSEFKIVEGTTIDEYLEDFSTSTTLSGSYKYFSGSVSVNYSSSEYSKYTNHFATVKSVINKNLVQLKQEYDAEDLIACLSDSFREDINDSSVPGKEIFQKYGTHCMRSLISGGRLDYNVSVDSTKFTSSTSIGVHAEAAFKSVFASASVENDTEKTSEQKSFEENMQKTLQVYGGASEYGQNIINKNDYDAWVESIADNHVFCEFGTDAFIPVWELCEDTQRSSEIKEAFDSWAQERQFDDSSLSGSMIVSFNTCGDWNRTGGDDEMDLDGDDLVNVNASVSFKVIDSTTLQVSYTFNIKEDGGDGTEFGKNQVILLEYEYTGPGELVGLGCDSSYTLTAQARNNDGDSGFFPEDQWSDLERDDGTCYIYYVADSEDDDNDSVGITGKINVPIRYVE